MFLWRQTAIYVPIVAWTIGMIFFSCCTQTSHQPANEFDGETTQVSVTVTHCPALDLESPSDKRLHFFAIIYPAACFFLSLVKSWPGAGTEGCLITMHHLFLATICSTTFPFHRCNLCSTNCITIKKKKKENTIRKHSLVFIFLSA